jgi:hypothetical protein
MRKVTTGFLVVGLIPLAVVSSLISARGQDCQGNPNALGTSRVMAINPAEYPKIGAMDHAAALPLSDKEVVLTFDDGPLPRYSNQILDILAAQCVKATFSLSEKWLAHILQRCAGFSRKVIQSELTAKIIHRASANCRVHWLNGKSTKAFSTWG